ncbi:MAG: adenylate/guanylate cyclase domain-containing protein [Acidimicrobiales bacterium]|jgi:adenylate cyclase
MNDKPLGERISDLIIGEPKYTSVDVAAATGMTEDDAERLWIELGFTPVDSTRRQFTDADIQVLKTLRELQASGLVGEEVIISMTRVLGQALSRVAYAQAENIDVHPSPDGSSGQVVIDDDSLSTITEVLFNGHFDQFLSYAWRRHLAEAVRQRLDNHEQDGVVGFADLVGYSTLTTQIDPVELPNLISNFEQVAYQHVSQAGGRVLKLIGDAVMFTAPDPVSGAEAALGLRTSRMDDSQLPKVRVGLAMGALVGIEGDLFGDTVNRASRLTGLAHPGTVLVDDTLGRALDGRDDLVVRPLRPRKLKGLGYVRTWVLRPVDTNEP